MIIASKMPLMKCISDSFHPGKADERRPGSRKTFIYSEVCVPTMNLQLSVISFACGAHSVNDCSLASTVDLFYCYIL